jgi:hypothetical protein
MSLPNTNQGDVPQVPFAESNTYLPDQLLAGVFPRVTDNITVLSGATVNSVTTLARGTVMGQITLGAATAAATGGNTGNGTSSAVTRVGTKAIVGAYTILFTAATKFDVIDPNGRKLSSGTTGVAYSDDIAFTITAGGTAFVAGDSFTVTVAAGSGKYIPSVTTAVDGSENPVCILADKCDPSAGDVTAGVYRTGEFNSTALTFDTSWTAATLTAPLRALSMFLKSVVSATDPS